MQVKVRVSRSVRHAFFCGVSPFLWGRSGWGSSGLYIALSYGNKNEWLYDDDHGNEQLFEYIDGEDIPRGLAE